MTTYDLCITSLKGERNTTALGASYRGWGDNYCENVESAFFHRASSAKYVGSTDGYKYDTFNLYQGEYFAGDETFLNNDISQLPANADNQRHSAIVTGCTPWTIYEYDNFEGNSYCLYPADTNNCYPGFFPSGSDLGGLSGKISSVRRGCFSKNGNQSTMKEHIQHSMLMKKIIHHN